MPNPQDTYPPCALRGIMPRHLCGDILVYRCSIDIARSGPYHNRIGPGIPIPKVWTSSPDGLQGRNVR